ncbi:MAG: S24 family peptidase [bacterium]|nr:S24 family peptidase [bacterium]
MHIIQEKLLKLTSEQNIGNLKLREIGDLIGTPHPQLIKHHLNQLEQKGFIVINRLKKTIERVGEKSTGLLKVIPILGTADCGPANFYADQNIEGYLKISSNLLKSDKKLFALRASGDSMNQANIENKSIENGDYVIVEPGNNVSNNDYVVSIIDGVCNIKKLYVDEKNEQIILLSESSKNLPPIILNPNEINYYINGKVIKVVNVPN